MRLQLQKHLFRLAAVSLLVWVSATFTPAQTTSFTYQGRLTDGGTPANGSYDLQFTLWDLLSGGTQQPQPTPITVTRSAVSVSGGIFTVPLDFGATAFPGADRFLEISARLNGTPSFTTLAPRQPITSTPYAIRSLNASSADAVTVSGVPGGSGNYIQNATTQQASANFNISGNGTAGGTMSANIVNAATQYNIGGSRVLTTSSASGNLFAGVGAGLSSSGGGSNTYFGTDAGSASLLGSTNSYFGFKAGEMTQGNDNAFFGFNIGLPNQLITRSTLIGARANAGPNSLLENRTAIGAGAQVNQDNSMVLGSIAGVNGASASVNVGIGTTTPQAKLHVQTNGSDNIQLGSPGGETGMAIIKGTSNRADVRFDGLTLKLVAGLNTAPPPSTNGIAITTVGNVGIGTTSPDNLLTVNGAADKPGGGSWGTFSDERLKNLKGQFTPGLKAVMQLKPLRYEYKPDNALGLKLEGEQVGFSAQAVQRVIPEAVTKNDKGYLLVNNDPILWTMLNAIKEQQSQIERQQAEAKQQQEQIARQQLQIEQLQQQQKLIKLQEGRRARQQQQQIASLKRLVCLNHPRAGICK